MIRSSKLLAAVSGVALCAVATPALAGGTQSGTSVQNNVSVSYNVGNAAQTAVNATDTFVVDRKVNLTIVETGNTTTQVSPGQVNAVTAFTVTNTSNDNIDIDLALVQQVGGAGAHSNTDTFNVNNTRIFRDVNDNGLFDEGTDTLVVGNYLDEVAQDVPIKLIVVSDIPVTKGAPATNLVTGDVAAVTLTGTALAGGSAGNKGAALVQTAGANTAGVDTVFADTAGATDANRDGKFSAKDDYTVAAAALTAAKISRVISDPFNGTTNPKAIPGAVVEYCISVSNAATTNSAPNATATNVVVTDPVPSDLTFLDNSIKVNGTISNGVCSGGADGGSHNGTTVSGQLDNIPAGQNRTLVFRATIKG